MISAVGTPWGLVRHYWVVLKLVLTVLATAVLLVQLAPIKALAALAADPAAVAADFAGARRSLIHSVGGLIVLGVIQVLGIFKPRGVTRFGRRAAT